MKSVLIITRFLGDQQACQNCMEKLVPRLIAVSETLSALNNFQVPSFLAPQNVSEFLVQPHGTFSHG